MQVEISGAKNISLALLPATFFSKEIVFYNLPNIIDVNIEIEIMKSIGLIVLHNKHNKRIIFNSISHNLVPFDLGNRIRSSLYFLGAFLGLGKSIIIPHPGGCNAASRKIDMHVEALRYLGANVNVTNEYIFAKRNKMKAQRIRLPIPSKGVTINIIYSSLLLSGKTIIENASIVPEIKHLIALLVTLGYDIKIINHDIIIDGKPNHTFQTGVCTIPFDRIEAGTFAVLSLMLHLGLIIKGVDTQDISELLIFLDSVNTNYSIESDKICIARNQNLKPTTVYLGFPPAIDSDYGPVITPLLCLIKGYSYIVDKHNTHRVNDLLTQLRLIGAQYRQISENAFLIYGVDKFYGNCQLTGKEIRGTMGLVLASLVNHGNVLVNGLENLNRAYDDFLNKIHLLGLDANLR